MDMLIQTLIFCLQIVFSFCFFCPLTEYCFETTPAFLNEDEIDLFDSTSAAVHAVATVDKEVSVTCTVSRFSDDELVNTVWELLETGESLTFDSNGLAVNHSYISVSGQFQDVLTVNFTHGLAADTMRLRIGCKADVTSSGMVNITIGLPVGPTLVKTPIYDVVESSSVSVCLLEPMSDLFPDIMYFVTEWSYNDDPVDIIDDADNIVGDYFNLTINSVKRSYSNQLFKMCIIEPEEVAQCANFTLNVLFMPEAGLIGNDSTVYSSVGDNITFTGAMNISGNPTPSMNWSRTINGVMEVIEASTEDRYSINSDGQLMITGICERDFGLYRFTASNDVGENISVDTLLLEIEPRFKTADLESIHEGLFITWTLAHTGYDNETDELSISITCMEEDTADSMVEYNCSRNCINSTLVGSGTIEGRFYAGSVYSCEVLATTVNGTSQPYQISKRELMRGIPSTPVFSMINNTGGNVSISVYSMYPGDEDSLLFVIIIFNEKNMAVHNMTYTAGNESITIYVNLPPGNYSVNVTAQNEFGNSIEKSRTFQVFEVTTMSPSPTPSPTTDGPNAAAIVGGIVNSVAIVILSFIAIVLIQYG